MQVLGQGLEDALERQNDYMLIFSKCCNVFFFKFTIKTLDR